MNRREYIISVATIVTVLVAVIVTNSIFEYISNWWWIFIGALLAYMYLRYRISAPMQMFSTKFNMLVDYDLDIEAAEELAKKGLDNAPTDGIKQLYRVYYGMAKYYKGEYRNAINIFNQIDVKKLNPAYHILIFSFTAYAAYEEGDVETYDLALDRIRTAKDRVSKKYISFALSYLEVIEAIKKIDEDPEAYKDVIERHFSRNDGFISTKLIYYYRMAYYYKAINNIEEMDICLAKVIANGKEHHTALQAKKMFTGTCNIEDYVFNENGEEKVEDVETVEEPILIESISQEDMEVVEPEAEPVVEKAESEDKKEE